jgi:hypothetical protein
MTASLSVIRISGFQAYNKTKIYIQLCYNFNVLQLSFDNIDSQLNVDNNGIMIIERLVKYQLYLIFSRS